MDFNFRGKYDSTKSYAKKDVVSYQANSNDQVRFYMCLTNIEPTSPQSPTSGIDNTYWGVLSTQSNFPNSVDTFLYRNPIQANDMADINRIKVLKEQSVLSPAEQTELTNLTNKHRDKFFLAEDANALQQSLTNMQMFYKDNVEAKLNDNVSTINQTKDSALVAIENKKNSVIDYMDGTTAGALRNDIGVMGDLTTTNRESLVNAINEVKENIPTVQTDLNNHKADYKTHTGYAATTGSANAYIATLSPVLSAYAEGVSLRVKINITNTTASTINVNGRGVKLIKKANGNDVGAGQLKAGSVYTLTYNGTNFILQGEGASGNATASDLLSGKTATTDAGEILGTMPNRGVFNLALGESVPEGYYSGGLVPSGKRFAKGTVNVTNGQISLSGLGFTPSKFIIYDPSNSTRWFGEREFETTSRNTTSVSLNNADYPFAHSDTVTWGISSLIVNQLPNKNGYNFYVSE